MILFFLYILIFFQFILTICVCLYLIWSFVSIVFSKWVPFVSSFDDDLNVIKNNLKITKWKSIIDLWCGDGKALRMFIKNYDFKYATWYDVNFSAILFGKILNKILGIKNINLYVGDFLKISLEWYDYIYVYLLTEYMYKIEDFVFKNIWKNTIIISNSFKFRDHEPFKIIKNNVWKDRIYLYKKN